MTGVQTCALPIYKISDAEGIGFAIPISEVTSFLIKNGITIDNNGNAGIIVEEQSKGTDSCLPAEQPEDTVTKNHVNIALLIGLSISIALNIVMIIIIVFQKKKNINARCDSSERTDFDIDIWE